MDEDLTGGGGRPVTDELGDLLPLFLEEAGARLERLSGLLFRAGDDPGAAVQARRELHAVKGAARMMGLDEVAELCHRTEDCLVGEEGADLEAARELGERLAEVVDDLRDEAGAAGPAPSGAPRPRGRRRGSEIRGGSGEMRVANRIVDGLAERSTRLRLSAAATGALAGRLFELARGAGRAGGDGESRRALAELAISLQQAALELESLGRSAGELSEQQLDALLRLQVQPLRPFLRTLARHTRDLARSLDKEVAIGTSGGDVQLDRRILEAIREASLHLVRNAVDHGLESPGERERAGKEPVGRIRIEAAARGDRVRLTVADDGRGIDPTRIVELAVERGLIEPATAARLTADEAYQLLELPGFTTRDRATELSGRGVGMDAVATAIRSIGGDLWIRSEPGRGTTVTVELPVTRRGERLLVVRVGDLELALPAAAVRTFGRLRPGQVVRGDGRVRIRRGDGAVNAVFLAGFAGTEPVRSPVVVETNIGGAPLAVVVDEVVGEEEVFVRPIPAAAGAPVQVEGVALLASGRPVAVLELQRLGPLNLDDGADSVELRTVPRVLLVEDTRASREMLRRLLEDGGFQVAAEASVPGALSRLAEEAFDCVVTDVEMPDQDGLVLIRRIRDSGRWSELPVVVVSTGSDPAARLSGLSAGADAWFVKSQLDADDLLATVRRLSALP